MFYINIMRITPNVSVIHDVIDDVIKSTKGTEL